MQISSLITLLVIAATIAYFVGYSRSTSKGLDIGGVHKLSSLPSQYGTLALMWCLLPGLALIAVWMLVETPIINAMIIKLLPASAQSLSEGKQGLLISQVKSTAEGVAGLTVSEDIERAAVLYQQWMTRSRTYLTGLSISAMLLTLALLYKKIAHTLAARRKIERVLEGLFMLSSLIAILTTLGIVLSVIYESYIFFGHVSPVDFMFGTHWSPQMAMREDQAGSSGAFGAIPLFLGTMLISLIALIIAVPAGLMTAIYLSEYAHARVRSIVKPLLEILAGIPTVVYGFFAAVTFAPFLRESAANLSIGLSPESALIAGIVMGVMIIPFVSSLSDDVINAVPQSLRDGSLGLGATPSETIRQVVIPAALPGIVGGVLLAASRAIGETMIVVMAAGLAANLTLNPLESVTTVTVQIVTILVGDQEFDSPKTLAAFALGLMLFVTTLALNFVALHVVKKYREQYD